MVRSSAEVLGVKAFRSNRSTCSECIYPVHHVKGGVAFTGAEAAISLHWSYDK